MRVEEADIERGVVRHDDGAARELQEARQDLRQRGRAGDKPIVDTGQVRDVGRDGPLGVDQGLERPDALEAVEPHGADSP